MCSDHLPVKFTTNFKIKVLLPPKTRNYINANWSAFKEEINRKISINRNLNTKEEINTEIDEVKKIIQQATENNDPKTTNKEGNIPDEIQETIKRRNIVRRRFQTNRDPELQALLQSLN